MRPRANDTLAVVTSYGSNRVVRVAPDGSLFGADGLALGEPLAKCREWAYATREQRREFDECLRDHLLPPPMSVVVRRATVAGIAPPRQQARVAEYSFVASGRRR